MASKHLDKVSHDDELFYRELSREKAAKDRLVIEKERQEEAKANFAKSKAEAIHKITLNLLREGYDSSFISKVTGLSKTKISRLKNGK